MLSEPEAETLTIGAPVASDGADVHELIAACPPLDANSLYANLLQCSHFAQTCALARGGTQALGWVSGYLMPGATDTYFLWQVAVAESARGRGLPRRMVEQILARPACRGVRYLKTTITPDNGASWRLFRGLAERWRAPLTHEPGFDRAAHFAGRHDSEELVTIGPFAAPPAGRPKTAVRTQSH